MITDQDCVQPGTYEYKGLSTDTKPTNCAVNSLFLELDTGIFYFFNGTEWKNINERIALGESEPTGTITITNNGIFDVHDYAEADVDVPAITPTGTMSITENGTYDVANYAEASVDVDVTVNFNLPALTRSTPTELSEARYNLAAASVVPTGGSSTQSGYALFGGGFIAGSTPSRSAVVDAYDTILTRTTPTALSQVRHLLAATNVGNYALFGGGYDSSYSAVVDAYDTSLTRSTPTALSQARDALAATTVASAGGSSPQSGYALFGGGYAGSYSAVVDAYDTSLTRSTPTALSQARTRLAATSIGNYALFGGGSGPSAVVDAYDTSLTRTTPTELSQARSNLAATNIGNYALFGGGQTGPFSGNSDVVDAYDTSLTRSTPTGLSRAMSGLVATTIAPTGGPSPQSGYALFGEVGGSAVVDAYDTSLIRSTPMGLSQARTGLAATSVGNYALFGGGRASSNSAVVDAYTIASYDIQVFPGTKYSFNGSTEQTSSTWQTISMQGEVVGYIKVKNATVN